jgi:hypothetical protein
MTYINKIGKRTNPKMVYKNKIKSIISLKKRKKSKTVGKIQQQKDNIHHKQENQTKLKTFDKDQNQNGKIHQKKKNKRIKNG